MKSKQNTKSLKPEVQSYHDYRQYLKDLLKFIKNSRSLSMREVSKLAQISVGYLPMVLNQKRNLSIKNLKKLAPFLKISKSEMSYLENLMLIADSQNAAIRKKALTKIQSFQKYKAKNNKELEVFKYLSKWYYVAIREMVLLPNFELSPDWIYPRLQKKVKKSEIQQAIQFLLKNGFIFLDSNNKPQVTDKHLQCMSGIFRLSLTSYYEQVFALGAESMETVDRQKRNLLSHTLAIPKNKIESLKKILDNTLKEVQELDMKIDKEEQAKKEEVYFVGLMTYPLTKNHSGSEYE